MEDKGAEGYANHFLSPGQLHLLDHFADDNL